TAATSYCRNGGPESPPRHTTAPTTAARTVSCATAAISALTPRSRRALRTSSFHGIEILQRPRRLNRGREGIRYLSGSKHTHAASLDQYHGEPEVRRIGFRVRRGMCLWTQ